MEQLKSTSVRAYLMDELKERLGKLTIWEKIGSKLAIICSEIPETNNNETVPVTLRKLSVIHDYLLENGIDRKELYFLEDEIERYKYTKQMSVFTEANGELDENLIAKYSNTVGTTEGIIGIHLPLNYKQVKKLTNGVFKRTKEIRFFISKETTLCGKVVAECFEKKQYIPIAKNVVSKRKDKETGEPAEDYIALFGEKVSPTTQMILREIELPFYVYRFITEAQQELIVLSVDKKEIGDYILTGMSLMCDDFKALTESSKLPTKLPYFFAQSMKCRAIRYENNKELSDSIVALKINRDNIFNYPFHCTIELDEESNGKTVVLLHPEWYKWFVWSWLLHKNKGMQNKYPLHVLQICEPHSGKSVLLNTLHSLSKEYQPMYSGADSTYLELVPSFKYNPAKIGYLAESSRFAFCDELLKCLNRSGNKNNNVVDDSFATMNDLLEHQKRRCGSGMSSVQVNMTARMFAATNPIRGIRSVQDLLRSIDVSFLSRLLIYHQTIEHRDMIRKNNDKDLKDYEYSLSVSEWISIVDYLQSIKSNYNTEKMLEIYEEMKGFLSDELKEHYDNRHKHHISCIMDGLVKARCLMDNDMSFEATDEDFERLREIWRNIIVSWNRPSDIKGIPIHNKIYYLNSKCQDVFFFIDGSKDAVTPETIMNFALDTMTQPECMEALRDLRDSGLIKEKWGLFTTYKVN